MINKKWLTISIFIPIFGTVINFLLLYIFNFREKVFPMKKFFLGELLCSVVFFIVFVLTGLILRFMDETLTLGMESYVGMILAFIIAGIVMNVVFVFYYAQNFKLNKE